MYCTNCGSLLDDWAKFCGSCGAEVAGKVVSQEPAGVSPEITRATPKVGRRFAPVVLLGSAVVGGTVLLVLGLTGALFGSGSASKEDQFLASLPQETLQYRIESAGLQGDKPAIEITLFAILNRASQWCSYLQQLQDYSGSALDWIRSKGISPESLAITWKPSEPSAAAAGPSCPAEQPEPTDPSTPRPSPSPTPSPAAGDGGLRFAITLGDNSFDPARLVVIAGTTITLDIANNGTAIHNMRIAGPDGEFNTADDAVSNPDLITSGTLARIEWTVPDVIGDIKFHCDFHPTDMTGTITVQ